MNIEINNIVSLENKEEYLIIDKINKDNCDYYYIVELNKEKTDIKNNYKIVYVEEKEGKYILREVLGEEKLKEILPLFINNIKE